MKIKLLSYAQWNIAVIGSTFFIILGICGVTMYIDPLFHYHAPLKQYEYPLDDERYQNDGIVRNFKYNAIITGSSMVENFRTSECDELFGEEGEITTVKVPFAGASYKEVNENLVRAFEANADIKFVVRCLDYTNLVEDKDADYHGIKDYGYQYPYYLTNDNFFDDVQYLLNQDLLFNKTLKIFDYTKSGRKTTTFDEYMYWSDDYEYGKEAVLNSYTLGEKTVTQRILSDDEKQQIALNLKQNVTDLADNHSNIDFYIFFPPYSICYWDALNQNGCVNWRIDSEEYAIEELLKHPNVKLYSFCTEYDMIINLDNYRDKYHYGGWINSRILQWMSSDEHRLTQENYQEYIEEIRRFYQTYNYDILHE